MKITDVEGLVLRPGEVDATRADGTQDAFLVKIHTDEGITGVGEGDTSPYVACEMITMPASHSIARGFRELLIGEDPLRVRPLWAKMFGATYHYGRDGAAHSTAAPFRRLIEADVDVLQPDLGRCGGFTTGRDIAAMGREQGGVLVVPHCFSTDVLLAATLQFVATLGHERLIEFPVTAAKRLGTILTNAITPVGGVLHVPGGPGLGIELDDDEVERRRVRPH